MDIKEIKLWGKPGPGKNTIVNRREKKRMCLLFGFYETNEGLEIKLKKFCNDNNLKNIIRWNDFGDFELELPIGDSYTSEILAKEWDRPIIALMLEMYKSDPSIIDKIVHIRYEEKEGWN